LLDDLNWMMTSFFLEREDGIFFPSIWILLIEKERKIKIRRKDREEGKALKADIKDLSFSLLKSSGHKTGIVYISYVLIVVE